MKEQSDSDLMRQVRGGRTVALATLFERHHTRVYGYCLRMTGNRVGQIVFPALAGALAAVTGVAGILLALGVGLAASGITVALSQPPPPTT